MWTLYGLAEIGTLTGSIARRWRRHWAVAEGSAEEAADPSLIAQRMTALGLDADAFARLEPALFGNLKTLCGECESPKRCRQDLRRDPLGIAWEDYCPNAVMLGAIKELRWFRASKA